MLAKLLLRSLKNITDSVRKNLYIIVVVPSLLLFFIWLLIEYTELLRRLPCIITTRSDVA